MAVERQPIIEMRSRQFSGREVVSFVPGVRTALNSIRIPDASNIFVVLCWTEPSGISRVLTFYLIRNGCFSVAGTHGAVTSDAARPEPVYALNTTSTAPSFRKSNKVR